MVSGHRYRMVWTNNDAIMDWDGMRFQVTQYLWDSSEVDIILELPFRDYREDMIVEDEAVVTHDKDSKTTNDPNYVHGDWDWFNTIDPNFNQTNTDPQSSFPWEDQKWIDLVVSGDTKLNNWVDVGVVRCDPITDPVCDFVSSIAITGGPHGGSNACKEWSDGNTWNFAIW